MPVKRGEIYLVNWDPAQGSEQAGLRPALVIQNDVGNEYGSTTIVASISTRYSKIYPFQVLLHAKETGLSSNSVVDFGQIITIDKSGLIKKIGKIKSETISAINKAIINSLELR